MTSAKSIGTLLGWLLLTASAQASVTVAENYRSRDYASYVSLELDADGKACTKTTTEGQYQLPTTTEKDDSEACLALKVARMIKQKLGSCSPKQTDPASADSGVTSSRYVLSGKEGVVFNNPHDILEAHISEECFCGKLFTNNDNIGSGMINVLQLLFDGPYFKSDVTLSSVSARECANLFDSEKDKAAVLSIYQKYYPQAQ